jgi:EAL domain-containing protein (putative c-di-GMP-specific phosphodiesterase class I)
MRTQGHDDLAARLPRLLQPSRMARPLHIVGVVGLIGLVWVAVYAAGGTQTAWPHLFYFPIILAGLTIGLPGALAAAILAALACGPLMPLDTEAGTAQGLVNWLTRGGFFVGVGLFAGWIIASFRRSVEQNLAAHIEREVELATLDEAPRMFPEVAARLRETIENERFHPVYQPIYSLKNGRLIAVEALTRFDSPPPLPPNTWFAHASLAGMEAELDLITARAALETAEAQLPADIALHLNLTPTSLRDERLLELLTSYPGRALVVELTEHAAVDNYQRLESPCRRLRQHGIKLAVDDAGAGISSLRHIVKLAPEIIKLDISLTRNVRKDPVQHALADAFAQFATRIDAQLIVEGIEENADLTAWTRIGADAAQGYHLGRPGPLPHPHRFDERAPADQLARL